MLRKSLPALALVAAAVLLAPPLARAHHDELPRSRGFRATLGPTTSRLVIPGRTGATLEAEGVSLDTRGTGLELDLAWAFTPRFALGLVIVGTNSGDGDEPRNPELTQLLVETTTHLRPGQRIDPFLTGGLGGAFLGFGEDPGDGRSLEAYAISVGAGTELRLSRRWGMAFRYRYSVLDFDRQTVIVPWTTTGPIQVVGDAETHHLGVSCAFRL